MNSERGVFERRLSRFAAVFCMLFSFRLLASKIKVLFLSSFACVVFSLTDIVRLDTCGAGEIPSLSPLCAFHTLSKRSDPCR